MPEGEERPKVGALVEAVHEDVEKEEADELEHPAAAAAAGCFTQVKVSVGSNSSLAFCPLSHGNHTQIVRTSSNPTSLQLVTSRTLTADAPCYQVSRTSRPAGGLIAGANFPGFRIFPSTNFYFPPTFPRTWNCKQKYSYLPNLPFQISDSGGKFASSQNK